ncbi:MAG: SDR family NAD(P)-dependent oxidoreductase [Cyanobacteria bacterium HKST-UBA04]|nr:SDR family NAD(P)-dependent oxidoreductase [Cyanobacteria bacterium HKST-UBA04]MCA9842361.1 SDR family NAD(P)-dependent oxidoreductase [Cyanobacteria bacterium HKST-UBA03]
MSPFNWNDATVLVTGGAGFIGSHTCRKLLELGASVISLDNYNCIYTPDMKHDNMRRLQEDFGQRVVDLHADIADRRQFEAALAPYADRINAVVHLAALTSVFDSTDNPDEYVNVNVNATQHIADWMKDHDIRKMVFASSSSVYGYRNTAPFFETDDVSKPSSVYAATKIMCENLLHTYAGLYNMQVVALRFFNIYGPAQPPSLVIHKFAEQIFNKQPVTVYGDGSFQRDYTYVGDATNAIAQALAYDKANYDVFNIGTCEIYSVLDIIRHLEEKLGMPANVTHLPQPPGDVPLTHADTSKAQTELGYKTTKSFNDGIAEFVDWFLSYHNALQETVS